jgi:AcrR family transcriptional regulator
MARTSGSRKQGTERTKRTELVENEIIEAAVALFAEHGVAGTTPQDIAAAAGITRQGLYYYFGSKDDILVRLVAQMMTPALEKLEAIHEETDRSAVEKLRDFTLMLVQDRARNRLRFRALDRSESALPPELRDDFLAARRRVLALLVDAIRAGIDDGSFRQTDPRVAALSIIGMCNWVAWWYEPDPGRVVDPLEYIADNAVAMLVRPPPSATVGDALRGPLERLRADLNDVFEHLD